MADPRPLTRKELAEFLPSQRAIRAFEKLFDLVPLELEDVLVIAEGAQLSVGALKTENSRLKQQVFELETELLAKRPTVPAEVLQRLSAVEQQLDLIPPQRNLDQLRQRVDILEALEGLT